MAKRQSNSVQELVQNGTKEVPKRYVFHKAGAGAGEEGFDDAFSPALTMVVPVIDVSCLESSEELHKLQSALSSCGYIQLINHGMTSSFLDQVHQITKDFFALPMKEKKKYSRTLDDEEGYGNDSVLSEEQIFDWSDRLYLTLRPQEQINLNFWPNNPQDFKDVLQEFAKKLEILTEILFKAMAKSLNLKEKSFLNEYGENPNMTARFNFYPLCPITNPDHDLPIGSKPHTDGSAITFLLPDNEVEGLQVLKDEHWFKVPIIPSSLFLNVGDQVEIMSNGEFKGVYHRVVTNSDRDRVSLAVFCMPEKDKEVGPIEELISEENPILYKRVVNFVDTYFQDYEHGKRSIDAAKL